jgi:ABC-type glycerol-3-phosphate transport system permease component
MSLAHTSAAIRTRQRFKRVSTRTVIYVLLVIILLVQFFPLLWTVLTSLMTTQETTSTPATLLPAHPNAASYASVLQGSLSVYYRNSVIASLVSTLITMLLSTFAAYAFARLRFRFKTPLLIFVLFLSLFPPLAQVIPVYQILQSLHLIGTLGALILPYSVFGLPLAVLVLIAFFQDVPIELEEAAIVDGLNRFGTFLRIVLPVTLPGLFTAAIIVFVGDWNEYLFALNYTTNNSYTLPVGIVTVSQTEFTTNFGVLSAATVLSIVPLVILILLLERRIVSGLTAGALKG